MWSLSSSVEDVLLHTPEMLADRQKIYGMKFIPLCRSVFTRDLATYQLAAVNHLMDQEIIDYKSLGHHKLKAIQLAIGLTSKKTS